MRITPILPAVAGALALSFGALSFGSALAVGDDTAPFSLPDLPYAADALEPAIDAETMRLHHGEHHQAYVDNLNEAVEENPELQGQTLEAMLARISTLPESVRDNGGGHWNHALFWTLMAPEGQGGAPSAELGAAIDRDFGSLDAFKEAFNDAAADLFGSGWAWLVVRDGGLEITTTQNQDNPLMDVAEVQGAPVLALDVWEHAYYLQYQNVRADYLENWWSVVNWDEASRLFAEASDAS